MIAAETEQQRDTSEDPVNMFTFNFRVKDNNYFIFNICFLF